VSRGHDHGAAGVGGDATHRTRERIRHHRRVENVVDGDRLAPQRARVARRPVALRNDHLRERAGVEAAVAQERSAPSVSSVIGPTVPYGSSNWPCHESAAGLQFGAPRCERPLSPCAISTTSQSPRSIAAAA
jgi:hypothetical protein